MVSMLNREGQVDGESKGLNHVQKGKGSLVLQQGRIGISKIMEAYMNGYMEEVVKKGQWKRE